MWSVRRESSRSEVAEWEEPRHPGPAVPRGSYPTLSHSATQISSFVPQSLSRVRKVTVFPCKHAISRGGWGEDPNPVGRAVLRAGDGVARRIAVRWARPYPRAMSRARLLVLPSLLLIAVLLAACGGAGGAAGADPAKAVPAGTAIYIEGLVRPEGDQRDDVLDAARKVLRTDDPEAKLRELIDKGLEDSDGPASSYEKDIAPWLGQKAAVWVAGVNRAKPGYVVLVAAKDTDKAQQAIDKGLEDEKGVKQRSYEGVDYQVDSDGVAAGIVGDFFTVGTEPEFKRTVRAEDGDSLANDKRFKSAIDDLDDNRIGSFYLDLKPFIEQAVKSDPRAAGQLEQLRSIFPIDKLEPLSGALLAAGDRIAFDTIMRGSGVKSLGAFSALLGTGKTPLIAELPGDAWAAYGAPNVGPGLKTVFTRVAGAFGGAAATQQLQQQYGIDLERDVFGWIGDIALFVRGSDKASLEGALVIKATNAENMRNAFGKLAGLIQSQGGKKVTPVKVKGAAAAFSLGPAEGLGKPAILARSDDRVVIGVGEAATADALAPGSKLGDSELYGQAKELLDDVEPTLLLSMPDLVKAVDASGDTDADWQKAKPYLEAFTVIASGGKLDDDELQSRAVAGLK